MVKTIGFRPTPKIQEHIDSELEKHPKKSKSEIIIELCEQALSYSGQPREGPPSPIPTGVIIQCPMRPLPVPFADPILSPFTIWKTPVDSSVCKTCSKYPCESWEIIQSEERVGIERSYHQTLREHGQL